jgi:hypothetical protein
MYVTRDLNDRSHEGCTTVAILILFGEVGRLDHANYHLDGCVLSLAVGSCIAGYGNNFWKHLNS